MDTHGVTHAYLRPGPGKVQRRALIELYLATELATPHVDSWFTIGQIARPVDTDDTDYERNYRASYRRALRGLERSGHIECTKLVVPTKDLVRRQGRNWQGGTRETLAARLTPIGRKYLSERENALAEEFDYFKLYVAPATFPAGERQAIAASVVLHYAILNGKQADKRMPCASEHPTYAYKGELVHWLIWWPCHRRGGHMQAVCAYCGSSEYIPPTSRGCSHPPHPFRSLLWGLKNLSAVPIVLSHARNLPSSRTSYLTEPMILTHAK